MDEPLMNEPSPMNAQRRRARRNALWFGLLAFGVYLTFIGYAVTHGHR